MALPCICCGKQLPQDGPRLKPRQARKGWTNGNHPSDGVECSTRGNYGSTVWDEACVSTKVLSFNVCDGCLTAAADKGRIGVYDKKDTNAFYKPMRLWRPGVEDDF